MTSLRLSLFFTIIFASFVAKASLPINGLEYLVIRENPPQMRVCGPTKGTLFKGNLVIPDSVVRPLNGRKYAVVEIGSFDGNVRDTVFSDYSAFYNQPLITSVTIPATVTEIWHDAFRGCTGIRRWHVAEDNQDFVAWEGALYAKSKLTGRPEDLIRFPAASPLTEWEIPAANEDTDRRIVQHEAFRDNSTLRTVIIPSSVWLHEDAFAGNEGIEVFRGSGGINGVVREGMIMSKDGKTLLHVPSGRTGLLEISAEVTKIGAYAMACSHLTSINFNNVTEIGDHAFAGAHLSRMTIPSTITEVDYALFEDCKELEEVTIEAKITDVPSFMFRNCVSLKSVSLPTSCRGLRNECFSGCRSLQTFSLANYTRLGKGAPYVDERHFAMSGITKMNWPSKVEEVPDKMFFGCRYFKSVSLKETTQILGEYAFWATGIETFNTLNLTWIKDYALNGCMSLKKIVIAETDHTLMLGPSCFQLNTDTEVYLDHKDLYYKGWNTKPDVKDDWGAGAFSGRMDEIRLYTSLVNPAHFLPRWKVVYCPALTYDFYAAIYPRGNVAEMFSLKKDEDGYKAEPNYDWVVIKGVEQTASGVEVRYTANGESLHSIYTNEMLADRPNLGTEQVSAAVEPWQIDNNSLISTNDELEILYLCDAEGREVFSGRLPAQNELKLRGGTIYMLKWRVGTAQRSTKLMVR